MFSSANIHALSRVLAIFALGFVLVFTACKHASDQRRSSGTGVDGTIYVRQSQSAGFSALDGEILDLTCDYVRINVVSTATNQQQRLLFTRDAVQQIQLNDPGSANPERSHLYADWEKTAKRCWNRTKSLWVLGVQGIPWIGKSLSFLDNLPPGFGAFLAIAIFAVSALYGGFRFYDLLRQAMDAKGLNRAKLEREVEKLECEIAVLRQQAGLARAPVPSIPPIAVRTPAAAPKQSDQAPLRLDDFLMHTLLRVPRKADIDERREQLQKKWLERGGKSDRGFRIVYWARLILNFILSTFVIVFGISSLTDLIVFLLPTFAADFTFGERLWSSFSCFVFALVCASVALKLRVRRKILREAYRNVRTELAKRSAVAV